MGEAGRSGSHRKMRPWMCVEVSNLLGSILSAVQRGGLASRHRTWRILIHRRFFCLSPFLQDGTTTRAAHGDNRICQGGGACRTTGAFFWAGFIFGSHHSLVPTLLSIRFFFGSCHILVLLASGSILALIIVLCLGSAVSASLLAPVIGLCRICADLLWLPP